MQMNLLNKIILSPLKKLLDAALKPMGYICVRKRDITGYYLYEYETYEQYRDLQVFHNRRKLERVWADKKTLDRVAKIVADKFSGKPIRGLCHGARNGFEQNYLRSLPSKIEAIGTDISETANDFENSIHWDFHDTKDEWKAAFDFIYTNSLDQSWQPKQALLTWLEQLHEDGVLIIEHTEAHSPRGASEMDPFGVYPTVMPYVLTMWFGSQISISHTVAKKENNQHDAWLFVISKNVDQVVAI